jgi:hypothetical protein
VVKRPLGVTTVAVVILLVGAALAYLFMLMNPLGMMVGGLTASERLRLHAALVLPVSGFLLSYSMLRGVTSKSLWYGAFVYRIALAILCVSVYHTIGAWGCMWYLEGRVIPGGATEHVGWDAESSTDGGSTDSFHLHCRLFTLLPNQNSPGMFRGVTTMEMPTHFF